MRVEVVEPAGPPPITTTSTALSHFLVSLIFFSLLPGCAKLILTHYTPESRYMFQQWLSGQVFSKSIPPLLVLLVSVGGNLCERQRVSFTNYMVIQSVSYRSHTM